MPKIKSLISREIIDSRGNPTIECDIILQDNSFGRASVPSGASTGRHEALELRDNEKNRYGGKGVLNAINNINNIIAPKFIDQNFESIDIVDKLLIELDGTKNKSKLGANSTLAVSLAFAKSLSNFNNEYLFKFISSDNQYILPVPMINIINGGSHADNNLDIQEFMIAPIGANKFSEAIRIGSEVFHSLKSTLKSRNYNTNVGDEGGFAPDVKNTEEVIELIISSVENVGLELKKDILLSMDFASTEFYKNNHYHLNSENKKLSSDEMIDYINNLISNYPIYSIEDGMAEDDWEGWINLTKELGSKIQLVGDDLFVTNNDRLNMGIQKKAANSILIKLNQIGTLSETLSTIKLAKKNNFSCVISHRSGETEDTTISDLSVGVSSGQIKTGSLSRTDRTAKYNQLIRIEEFLGKNAKYNGINLRKH